jgi:glycerophosphoryl diester phosphodiesterase
VLFISFGADVLAAIKKELPEYKAYWVTSHSVYKKDKKTNKKVGRPLTVEEILKTLREINADGVDICFNKKIVTPKLVDAIKDAGFSCHVWTVDDIANAKAAFAAGVDTLTTNRAKGILDDYNSGK